MKLKTMKTWPRGVPKCDPLSPDAFEATWEEYIDTKERISRLVGYQKGQPKKRAAALAEILIECYKMNPNFRSR